MHVVSSNLHCPFVSINTSHSSLAINKQNVGLLGYCPFRYCVDVRLLACLISFVNFTSMYELHLPKWFVSLRMYPSIVKDFVTLISTLFA